MPIAIRPLTARSELAPFLALEGVALADVPVEPVALAAIWLADWDATPAGLAVTVVIPKLDARRGFLFVDELLVLPAFRRRGVARALLAYLEQQAYTLGLAGVRLLARPENVAAMALYGACGYAPNATVFFQKLGMEGIARTQGMKFP